jgi:hypothetical protein
LNKVSHIQLMLGIEAEMLLEELWMKVSVYNYLSHFECLRNMCN